MIVRTTEEITGTERDVQGVDWRSKRIILADDGVGFSLHETKIEPGTTHEFCYRNHVEAVWVMSGWGMLTNLENDEEFSLGPGSMYLLDGHERHRLTAFDPMRMICVFNPPVTGAEVHDETGAYPAAASR